MLVDGERTQLHQTHAELVVAAAAAQPAQLNQALEYAMCRRAWQAGTADDLGQRQPARSVECVEDQRDAVDDGRGGSWFDGVSGRGHRPSKAAVYLVVIFLLGISVCITPVWLLSLTASKSPPDTAGVRRRKPGSAQVSLWQPNGPRGGRRN